MNSRKCRGRVVAVSVDDSDSAQHALEWTVRNIVQRGDQLHILAVEPPCSGPYPAEVAGTDCLLPDPGILQQYRQEVQQHSYQTHQLLEGCQERVRRMGVRRCRVSCVQLPPRGGASGVAHSLVRYSQEAGASMVVVGSRGMQEGRRWLMNLLGLGSVSDYVVMHANCPVIVVKGNAASM